MNTVEKETMHNVVCEKSRIEISYETKSMKHTRIADST